MDILVWLRNETTGEEIEDEFWLDEWIQPNDIKALNKLEAQLEEIKLEEYGKDWKIIKWEVA